MTNTTDAADENAPLQTDRMERVGFRDVLERELEEIQRSRDRRSPKQRKILEQTQNGTQAIPPGIQSSNQSAHDAQLIGLALSGGGIRSATFNLGVFQGLAELGLLPIFDYLSTVSGGGYIGAWLTAWIQRDGIDKVTAGLRVSQADRKPKNGTAAPPEASAVRFLRSYSNYLTPRLGLFSSDTWTLIAVYLRNFLLNFIILVATFIWVLLVPRWILLGAKSLIGLKVDYDLTYYLTVGALILVGLGLAVTALNLRFSPQDKKEPWYTRPKWIRRVVVSPFFLSAILASCCLFQRARPVVEESTLDGIWTFAKAAAVTYFVSWAVAWLLSLYFDRRRGTAPATDMSWGMLNATAVPAGALGGILFWALYQLFAYLKPFDMNWKSLVILSSFGPPLAIGIFVLIAFLHMGLAGRAFPDDLREWLSRLAGWLLIYSVGWSCLFLVALFSPPLIGWMEPWAKAALGSTWVGSTLAGVLAGKSAKTNGKSSRNLMLDVLAKVAPPVFVVGLLVALSLGIDTVLVKNSPKLPEPGIQTQVSVPAAAGSAKQERPSLVQLLNDQMGDVGQTVAFPQTLAIMMGAALAAAMLFSWRVDVNEFSMHLLYRNRLARCYLGASARRRPHPFTGFYVGDDLLLARLRTEPPDDETPYEGPYPIVNTAINLVRGRNLAWQERKAASFTFTPLFSGFDLPVAEEADCPDDTRKDHAFRRTNCYGYPDGGVYLGTAMAISGAAASPNSGYHSSPALTFLLTVFNVRLGWWLGNPRGPRWREASPPGGPLYLLGELTGRTNDESDFVYLSDGGHFENLGVYELVKRRCRLVVACDATQDEDSSFSDLGNAIRKCRTDFGIDIEIDTGPLQPRSDSGFSTWHCAVGKIRYDQVDPGAAPGTLLYIKPSLTGDEPTDLLNYRSRHPAFPHQSTGDQFFAESQFESYRKLGLHIVREVFLGALRQSESVDRQHIRGHNEGLIAALRERWYPPSPEVADNFTQFTETLDKLYERLRTDDKLRFLDGQFYPEWRQLLGKAFSKAEDVPPTETWLPKDPDQIRAGFYLCSSLIQLMEDIYLALNLDQEADHPDNRGWMNLFKHWSWSGMLRATWAVSACTYGVRFQRFCERDLDLKLGEISVERHAFSGASGVTKSLKKLAGEGKLNPIERRWILDVQKDLGATGELVTFSLAVKPPLSFKPDKKDFFSFVFGFALVQDGALLYLRIQDHMRKMGLARKALNELVLNQGVRRIEPSAEERARAKVKRLYFFNEADCQRCLRLWKSVRVEVEEIRQDPKAKTQGKKAAEMGVNPDR
ncbi:MAG TPA: patatin-like phospholipase family protein [Thermoanaerobaculia bacterium]|jgi:predicted acylesterase/phospholipase RssA|nr:patatin-like phospholipase family protein [Thermoanaerobaculia bacterium]